MLAATRRHRRRGAFTRDRVRRRCVGCRCGRRWWRWTCRGSRTIATAPWCSLMMGRDWLIWTDAATTMAARCVSVPTHPEGSARVSCSGESGRGSSPSREPPELTVHPYRPVVVDGPVPRRHRAAGPPGALVHYPAHAWLPATGRPGGIAASQPMIRKFRRGRLSCPTGQTPRRRPDLTRLRAAAASAGAGHGEIRSPWLPRADCDDRCHSDLSSDSGRTRLRMALRVTAALCLLSGLPDRAATTRPPTSPARLLPTADAALPRRSNHVVGRSIRNLKGVLVVSGMCPGSMRSPSVRFCPARLLARAVSSKMAAVGRRPDHESHPDPGAPACAVPTVIDTVAARLRAGHPPVVAFPEGHNLVWPALAGSSIRRCSKPPSTLPVRFSRCG